MTHENVLLVTQVSLHQLSANLAKEGVTGVKLCWVLKEEQDQQGQKCL